MIKFFTCKNAKYGLLAGILIGLGVIINLQVDYKPLGATLFSFGLLTIINSQFLSYTGKIGFISREQKLLPTIYLLLFNLIGIAATTWLYITAHPEFMQTLGVAAASKFAKSSLSLFIDGVFCGMLIHFAVKNKQIFITIFAVVIFILIGAEHCIADFPFLFFSFSFINLLKYLLIIVGNSIGAILIERLCKDGKICRNNS